MAQFIEEPSLTPTPILTHHHRRDIVKGFKINSAQWGAKSTWLDVTEKIREKCRDPKTPVSFTNEEAGRDVCFGVKKSLVIKFLHNNEEKTAILAEGERVSLISTLETTTKPDVVPQTDVVQKPLGLVDITAILPALKQQNSEMYGEFFERNCMEIVPKHVAGKRVLDIGANRGMFALFCRSLGSKEVLAVEPDHSNFRFLSENVAGYGITPLNCAATDSRTTFVRMVDNDSLAKAVPDLEGTIPAMPLSQLLSWFPKDDNDLVLKIDTEGSEYDILLDASGDDVRRFSIIFIEVHPVPHLDKRTARTPQYMEEYLSYLGFSMEARRHLFNWKWDENGNPKEYEKIKDVESWTLLRK
jgi:FkbM family methyltransferase